MVNTSSNPFKTSVHSIFKCIFIVEKCDSNSKFTTDKKDGLILINEKSI